MTATTMHMGNYCMRSVQFNVPVYNHASFANSIAIQRLPTEPVGTTNVTFDGVHAGSEIRVYLPDGTEVAGIETCVDDQVLFWDVYSLGNANNIVRVVIVNVLYKLKEFNYTSRRGDTSLPIQQELDNWYSNPI